jgi:hypothetical protein
MIPFKHRERLLRAYHGKFEACLNTYEDLRFADLEAYFVINDEGGYSCSPMRALELLIGGIEERQLGTLVNEDLVEAVDMYFIYDKKPLLQHLLEEPRDDDDVD